MSPPPAAADGCRVGGSTAPPTVEWRYDSTTTRWLRGVALVRTALLGGATVVVFVVLAVLVSLLAASADPTLAVVALFYAAVRVAADPNTLALVTRDDRLSVFPEYRRRTLPRRTRRLVAVPGAVVLLVAAWLSPPFVLVPVAVGLGALVVLAAFSTEGRLEAAERQYVSQPGAAEWSFAGLSGYTRHRLGPVVVFRLRYPRRPGRLSKLQRVWVPAARAPDAATLFDAVASTPADAPEPDGRSSNRTVTLVAGAMGGGVLAGSVAAVVGLGGVLGWYLGAIGATFGLLLLAVAVFEG